MFQAAAVRYKRWLSGTSGRDAEAYWRKPAVTRETVSTQTRSQRDNDGTATLAGEGTSQHGVMAELWFKG